MYIGQSATASTEERFRDFEPCHPERGFSKCDWAKMTFPNVHSILTSHGRFPP